MSGYYGVFGISGPLGIERWVFVGFGPKRTSGVKIIKIGLGGGTGPYSKAWSSLMDGLLKDICTEGERGSVNWLILWMNSTDRLREMWMRGVLKVLADVF